MPLQNRVMPDGIITDDAWRGTFMGNRGGRIHDPATKRLTKRRWASKRWICCVLEFKKRQRTLMGESYTELFFLDEVSALASGHRPCFECRKRDANSFADAWERAFGTFNGSRADEMDRVLQSQRISEKPMVDVKDLPNGAMIKTENGFLALRNGEWMLWSGTGYHPTDSPSGNHSLLTPPAILRVFQEGYKPHWHESAG